MLSNPEGEEVLTGEERRTFGFVFDCQSPVFMPGVSLRLYETMD